MTQKQLTNQYEVELQRQILKLYHSLGLELHLNNKGSKKFNEYQRLALIIALH